MRSRSSYSVSPPKVIVSRSHSGKVKSYILDAFGNGTTIIKAGGAGEERILLHLYFNFRSIACADEGQGLSLQLCYQVKTTEQ